MSRFLSSYTDIHWTLIGFVIFIVLFVLLVGSTFLKSQIRIHRHLERLPLEDQPPKES